MTFSKTILFLTALSLSFTACSQQQFLLKKEKVIALNFKKADTNYTKDIRKLEEIEFKDDDKLTYFSKKLIQESKKIFKKSNTHYDVHSTILHHYLTVFPTEVFTKVKYKVTDEKNEIIYFKEIALISKNTKDAPLQRGLDDNINYFLNDLEKMFIKKEKNKLKKLNKKPQNHHIKMILQE